ncbi:hypothetical protein SAMN05421762_2237 [Pseudooceanicola nitratireducens]|jgi:hypothetical protein|uniref:Uncharacterized protein n=1 Tax=Pseudooceanicola nitratireducens TaxID=517719 RepID=A0A1I1MD82_9RHOB|nr:hypothetical protein [Pseudooceanicola nitratireducens]SEI91759.1 hypothetical protein SAMN05216183_1011103 [Pseudooceanicola nitratireducens]SFC79640.1 hypothetical protein SAMN05421762_2237 [Pseudooceanicola nitratireducens]
MAHENQVLQSVNLEGETICVDIFRRPDGSYGFDEFRRDPEDGRGWYSIGYYGDQRYPSEDAARAAARQAVAWFADLTA